MSKCRQCGREVEGSLSFGPFTLCSECILIEQNEEKKRADIDERRRQEYEAERQEREEQEREKARERRHREEEEARERRHREELEAIERADAAQQRRYAKLKEQQAQENDFEKAKMRCLYCKRTYSFRNDDGHGIYCSPKCAIDALGSLDYKQYLFKIDVLLQEKVKEFLDSKKYLNAIICAEGCKSLAPDIKGEIGYRCLNFPNAHVDSAWGKKILKEAVIEGSLKSAKLFFSYNFSPDLSNSAFSQMVKILLPYIEDMKNEFNKMFNSFDKLKVLEDIWLKFDNQSVIREKVDSFIQQKRLMLLQEEYELALTRKANAKTAEEFLAAADLFDSLANKNFKDAIEQSSICRNMGLQLKIDFAEQQREKAQSFEDYLGVIELYLELNDFNVENVNSWIEFFYLKADSELDKELISLPSTYDDRIRKINLLETKGFVYSGQLREKCRGKIEALWHQAFLQARSAETIDDFRQAKDFLEQFSILKKDESRKMIIEALWHQALLQVSSAKNFDELMRAQRVLEQFITLKTEEAKKMIRIVEEKRTRIERICPWLPVIIFLPFVAAAAYIMIDRGDDIFPVAVICFSLWTVGAVTTGMLCENVLQRIAFKIYQSSWILDDDDDDED